MVFTSEQTTLRLKDVPIPELADAGKLITLPDLQPRDGTPTNGWQWMRVEFINPSTGAGIEDWFGLNTGDDKIVLKKQSVADKIKLQLKRTDSCNYDSKSTIVFTEASKPAKLDSSTVKVREEIVSSHVVVTPETLGADCHFCQYLQLWICIGHCCQDDSELTRRLSSGETHKPSTNLSAISLFSPWMYSSC